MACGACQKIRNALKITVRFIPARRPSEPPENRNTMTRLGSTRIVRHPVERK